MKFYKKIIILFYNFTLKSDCFFFQIDQLLTEKYLFYDVEIMFKNQKHCFCSITVFVYVQSKKRHKQNCFLFSFNDSVSNFDPNLLNGNGDTKFVGKICSILNSNNLIEKLCQMLQGAPEATKYL